MGLSTFLGVSHEGFEHLLTKSRGDCNGIFQLKFSLCNARVSHSFLSTFLGVAQW